MSTWYHALNHPIGSIGSLPAFVCGRKAECIGGNRGVSTATANTDVVDRTWFARVNEARKGIDVLVSAEYIQAVPYYIGHQFPSTYGSIVRMYWDSITREHWRVCDFGTNEIEVCIPATVQRRAAFH
jgi:hypothetical protein